MRFKFLRTGLFKDKNGAERQITDATLDAIVAQFQQNGEPVPIVLGHPKDNHPAYGWVSKIEKIGDSLIATADKVAAGFKEAIQQGAYRNRSVSFNADTHELQHIGFLGAVLPAVSGLGDVEFSEETAEPIEFSIEETEPVLVNDEPAQVDMVTKAEYDALQTQFATAQAEIVTLQKRIADSDAASRKAEFSRFIDAQIAAGKVLPAERASLDKLFISLDTSSVQFSANDENNPLVIFRKTIADRPVLIDMGRMEAPQPETVTLVPGSPAAIKHAMEN